MNVSFTQVKNHMEMLVAPLPAHAEPCPGPAPTAIIIYKHICGLRVTSSWPKRLLLEERLRTGSGRRWGGGGEAERRRYGRVDDRMGAARGGTGGLVPCGCGG